MYSVLLFYDDHYRGGRAGMTDFPSVELHSFPELFEYKKMNKIYLYYFFMYLYKFRERKERDKKSASQFVSHILIN